VAELAPHPQTLAQLNDLTGTKELLREENEV